MRAPQRVPTSKLSFFCPSFLSLFLVDVEYIEEHHCIEPGAERPIVLTITSVTTSSKAGPHNALLLFLLFSF